MNPVVPLADGAAASEPESIRIFVVATRTLFVNSMIRVFSNHTPHELVACLLPDDKCCFERFAEMPADILLVEKSAVEGLLDSVPSDKVFAHFQDPYPSLRIIIFGYDLSEPFVATMVQAGVRGFIDTSATEQSLVTAINEVYNGGYWIGRKALEQIIVRSVEMDRIVEQGIRSKIDLLQGMLTGRETEVFRCVLDGMSTREISSELCLSEQSIKLYLGRMFRKFKVSNRSQLILMAFQRVCPVNNMIQLFRSSLDNRRIRTGHKALVNDPLRDVS